MKKRQTEEGELVVAIATNARPPAPPIGTGEASARTTGVDLDPGQGHQTTILSLSLVLMALAGGASRGLLSLP